MEELLDLLEQPDLQYTNRHRRTDAIPAGYKMLEEIELERYRAKRCINELEKGSQKLREQRDEYGELYEKKRREKQQLTSDQLAFWMARTGELERQRDIARQCAGAWKDDLMRVAERAVKAENELDGARRKLDALIGDTT